MAVEDDLKCAVVHERVRRRPPARPIPGVARRHDERLVGPEAVPGVERDRCDISVGIAPEPAVQRGHVVVGAEADQVVALAVDEVGVLAGARVLLEHLHAERAQLTHGVSPW